MNKIPLLLIIIIVSITVANAQVINQTEATKICNDEGYSYGKYVSHINYTENENNMRKVTIECNGNEKGVGSEGILLNLTYKLVPITRPPTTSEMAERFGGIFYSEILPLILGIYVVFKLLKRKKK